MLVSIIIAGMTRITKHKGSDAAIAQITDINKIIVDQTVFEIIFFFTSICSCSYSTNLHEGQIPEWFVYEEQSVHIPLPHLLHTATDSIAL